MDATAHLSSSGSIVAAGSIGGKTDCSDMLIVTLSPRSGAIRRRRRIDGTADARGCQLRACEEPGCEERAPIDSDRAYALFPGSSGCVTVIGEMSMGRNGEPRTVIRSERIEPAGRGHQRDCSAFANP